MNGAEIRWKKSSSSFAGLGCVEIAQDGKEVLIRDSRVPGTVVRVDRTSWGAFLEAAKRGEFDRL